MTAVTGRPLLWLVWFALMAAQLHSSNPFPNSRGGCAVAR